jgi:hypothetical protein
MFKKHGFEIAGLTAFGKYVPEEEYARKRELAEKLRADPELLAQVKAEASARLSNIPLASKGVTATNGNGHGQAWPWLAAAGVAVAGMAVLRARRARG